MRISNAGVSLIKGFEGFSATIYHDSVGVPTVGYGHTENVHPGAVWLHGQRSPGRLTESEAAQLLANDLDANYAPSVNALKLPLNQNQFDALVSFVYNVGTGGIASDTHVGQALRAHQWAAAADRLLEWDKAGGSVLAGLKRRREAERHLFLKPVSEPPFFTPDERRWIGEYDRFHKANPTGPRQRALRRAMSRQRRKIWIAAHIPRGGGWKKANRLARYEDLKKRTS